MIDICNAGRVVPLHRMIGEEFDNRDLKEVREQGYKYLEKKHSRYRKFKVERHSV